MSMFWLGVVAIPAGALALALTWAAILLIGDAYGRWNGALWFRPVSTRHDLYGQAVIAAAIAVARHTYTFRLIPGWRITLSRYDYTDRMTEEQDATASAVRRAIAEATRK